MRASPESSDLKKHCRRREKMPRASRKRDMIHNDALPRMEVDPETYEVRADGVLLTCEPAKSCPWPSAISCSDARRRILMLIVYEPALRSPAKTFAAKEEDTLASALGTAPLDSRQIHHGQGPPGGTGIAHRHPAAPRHNHPDRARLVPPRRGRPRTADRGEAQKLRKTPSDSPSKSATATSPSRSTATRCWCPTTRRCPALRSPERILDAPTGRFFADWNGTHSWTLAASSICSSSLTACSPPAATPIPSDWKPSCSLAACKPRDDVARFLRAHLENSAAPTDAVLAARLPAGPPTRRICEAASASTNCSRR